MLHDRAESAARLVGSHLVPAEFAFRVLEAARQLGPRARAEAEQMLSEYLARPPVHVKGGFLWLAQVGSFPETLHPSWQTSIGSGAAHEPVGGNPSHFWRPWPPSPSWRGGSTQAGTRESEEGSLGVDEGCGPG